MQLRLRIIQTDNNFNELDEVIFGLSNMQGYMAYAV